ncbi:MAG: hypothetical protein QOE24_1897 [Frankiales bacterium]|nr:hypothetical protein [Frankiales bacterium]
MATLRIVNLALAFCHELGGAGCPRLLGGFTGRAP